MKPEIFILNEGNLFIFLRRALSGRKPYFLGVEPAMLSLARLLERVAKWALATNRACPASDLYPKIKALEKNSVLTNLYDVFATIEPWQNSYYRFDGAGQDMDYGMAFKQVTCKYVQDSYVRTISIEGILKSQGGENMVCLRGLNADAQALAGAWSGGCPDMAPRTGTIIGLFVNTALGLAISFYSLLWVILRTRLWISPVPVFLAADYLRDERDNRLYKEAEKGGPVLLIKRTPGMVFDTVPPGAGYLTSTWKDGRFGLVQALHAGATVFIDAFRIFKRYHWTSPRHFYALATLPHKRIVIRALLNRYRPRHFWGRDEYNVEHILRHQELRRIGSQSLGLMHGVQALGDLNPRRRYISFDVFYVFGSYLYNKCYRRTWAAEMKVRAVGSFGFSRKQFLGPRTDNPHTIVVFGAYCIDLADFAEVVRKVATSFPQYQILVKPKGVVDEALGGKICAGLDNVALTTADAAGLIHAARYVLSEASTVVTESIHLGVPTLMLDMLADHRRCLYRDFPGLCVGTAAEAVARLKAWEEGRETFDRTVYQDLIDLSGRWAFDIISEDMGLKHETSEKSGAVPC